MKELITAAKELNITMPPKEAPCHYLLISQDRCANCNRIKRFLEALEKAELTCVK